MSFTKRAFDNIGALSHRHPQVLKDLLNRFPDYVEEWELDLVSNELNLESVRNALMSDTIPDELDDILYLSSALGNSTGWSMIERQAEEDCLLLPNHNADLTDVDMAVLAAIHTDPVNPGLLRKAYARARIHAKCAYIYYAMAVELRHQYRAPTPESLAEAIETLRTHFVAQGYIRAGQQEQSVRIIPYDFQNEIWFLIGYADKKQRFRGCEADGEWKNFDFNPEQYDAVVYNKVFGDIRMNTKNQRKKDHQKYRLAIGRMLLDNGGAFHTKKKMVTLSPLQQPNAVDLFDVDDIPDLKCIEPIEIKYRPLAEPRTYTIRANKDSSLLTYNQLKPRLLPVDSTAERVVFEYRLTNGRKGQLTLAAGNKISYERDGDSLVLEQWLRSRGFVISYVEDAANGLAVLQAA